MNQIELSAEEREKVLRRAVELKALRGDPVATLTYAVEAQAWVRQRQPEGMARMLLTPAEILSLLRDAIPLLNVTNTPDPLFCRKVIYSLNFWRMGRYIGTRSDGDELLDEIGDVIAMRFRGPGRPDRPLYKTLGDTQDWKQFKRFTGWFRIAKSLVPASLRDEAGIHAFLSGRLKEKIPDFPDAFLPALARALRLHLVGPARGRVAAREATALWYMQWKTNKEQSDVEAANREVDRLRRLVGRHRTKPRP